MYITRTNFYAGADYCFPIRNYLRPTHSLEEVDQRDIASVPTLFDSYFNLHQSTLSLFYDDYVYFHGKPFLYPPSCNFHRISEVALRDAPRPDL